MREGIADEAQMTFLGILFDRVEWLLLGNLHLGVRPARDLDDHVQNAILNICEERDVVEGRDDEVVGRFLCLKLSENAMFCCEEISARSIVAAGV